MTAENKIKLIDDFMKTHQSGINTLYKINVKSDNNIVSFLENLKKLLLQNVNNLFQILLSRYFYINLSQYLLKINYQYYKVNIIHM